MRFPAMRLLAAILLIACAALPAAAGQVRVACVGDSITKGVGAAGGQDYPSQLGRILGGEYTVANFGASGRTLQRRGPGKPYFGDKYFNRAVASRPDIVVIMLGTNDGKAAVKADVFLADVKAMVQAFTSLPSKPKVFLCTPIPVVGDNYGISADVVNKQIVPLIRQAAKEMKLPLIDCYSPLVGKDSFIPDGVHPDGQGAAIVAKTIAAAIKGKPETKTTDAQAAAFTGEKKDWQGYDQYNFEFDGRKCFVIAPKQAAAGRPWVLRARFPEKPAGDVELLAKGFHVAYMDIAGMFGSPAALKHWDAFYKEMTEKYGLSKKVALVGISRGGLPVHKWAAANPEKVACIVGVAPVCDIKSWPGGRGLSGGHGASWQALLAAYGMTEAEALAYKQNPVDLVEPIAKAKIPVLHVYSPQDEGVPYEENTKVVADRLKTLGGDFTGIPIEVKRSSIEGNESLKQLQERIDKKNPKAVARAHSTTCNAPVQAAVAEFILKHAAAK